MNNDIRPPLQPRPPEATEHQPPQVIMNEKQASTGPLPVKPDLSNEGMGLTQVNKPKHINRLGLIIGAFLAIILLLLITAWTWYTAQLSAIAPESTEKVRVVIEPGTDVAGIAEALEQAGVIRSELAFTWFVRIQGSAGSLQSGAYRIGKAEDVPTIVKHMTSGKSDTFSLTFLPGDTVDKHKQVLLDAGYKVEAVNTAFEKKYDLPLFAGKPASANLEGYIYGETYDFAADATPEDILLRTFEEFERVIEENKLIEKFKKQGFNLYEGITFASIIQREESELSNQRKVSQVFHLRLKSDMPLGSDPTYQYIADKENRPRDPGIDSPYNTRIVKGLPPGPIASPGETALIAAASPAPGDYLYFLSGDDNKLYFGRTFEEHEQNIRNHCQQKCQIL